MQRKPLYQIIASRVQAAINCQTNGNKAWEDRHLAAVEHYVREYLPSGSGIDTGTKFNDDRLDADRLRFDLSFHHMDQHGGYDGWTDHAVIATPSLANGFDLRITGRNRNDIKDYLADTYAHALSVEIVDDYRGD